MLVLTPSAFLGAVGLEVLRVNAHWHTCFAVVAIRAVGEQAAAAKTLQHQFRILVAVNQVAGRGHLRTRRPLRQITAWVGRGCIKLQGL